MRFARQILLVLTLLGWLGAIGHVAWDHGGIADGGALAELLGGAKHHDHEGEAHGARHDDWEPYENNHGSPDGEGHHHDLAVLDGGMWMKAAELKTVLPNWVALDVAMPGRLIISLREGREIGWLPMREHAPPPDQRASGWLLVVQTALPVRGPSLG